MASAPANTTLLTQSLEKLLLDHEACGMALRLARGIERRNGDAAELIGEVVRLGQFLSHPHTRRHWRQELSVASPLLDRDTHDDWVAAGSRTAAERARQELERRRALPAPPPLPDDVERELQSILRAEAARAGLDRLPDET
jgi:trimethylamine--corrinoid protein Co-methyltransferase